ncbi:unnamed protein product, partial [Mesorhabditis belari]|uniref:Uncharacterized protein n=1 Tax=Mesorhabditis belari TaxID=2138241 RepID=A0AAF3FKM5_9BILA
MFKVLALIVVVMAVVVVYAEDATTGVTRHHHRDHTRPEGVGNHKDHSKHPKDFHGTGKPNWHKGEQKGEHGHGDHKHSHKHHNKKFTKASCSKKILKLM